MSPEEELLAKQHTEWVKAEVGKKRRQEYLNLIRSSTDEELADLYMKKDEIIRIQDEKSASQDQENERLQAEAETDKLTGLPNRRGFDKRMDRTLQEMAGQEKNHHRESDNMPNKKSFVAADVDGFKGVNDNLGHEAGDAVLEVIAKTMVRFLRPGDYVGRTGGDEISIILDGVVGEEAILVMQRVSDAVYAAIKPTLGNYEGYVGISFGIKTIDPNITAKEIKNDADAEMYKYKRAKKIALGLPISEAR